MKQLADRIVNSRFLVKNAQIKLFEQIKATQSNPSAQVVQPNIQSNIMQQHTLQQPQLNMSNTNHNMVFPTPNNQNLDIDQKLSNMAIMSLDAKPLPRCNPKQAPPRLLPLYLA